MEVFARKPFTEICKLLDKGSVNVRAECLNPQTVQIIASFKGDGKNQILSTMEEQGFSHNSNKHGESIFIGHVPPEQIEEAQSDHSWIQAN